MFNRFSVLAHRLRRAVSRSEWTVRLLGLPRAANAETRRGLVLIQIDGLSHPVANAAIDAGHMPFLQQLLDEEGYAFTSMYSGLPSTTPAVQGELFYGVRGAVPAFSYVDRANGRLRRMYEREAASTVEAGLSSQAGLLEGGSAYCDIYGGAASNARFCASTGTMRDFVRTRRPAALPFLAIAHIMSLVRIAILVPLELVLAVSDCLRGLVKGQDLWMEVKFVPTRVAICILLREMIVIAAKVDLARGLPVVQLNLIGYDEQAHRRGPSSAFAIWTLKGIDHAISRIVRASRRSLFRDYDIWVYSDHGQEETTPYEHVYGRTVHEAIERVVGEHGFPTSNGREPRHGVQLQRVRVLSDSLIRNFLAGAEVGNDVAAPDRVGIAAMGPLGHVYLPSPLAKSDEDAFCRDLVAKAGIPLVLRRSGGDAIHAWTGKGKFTLPDDAGPVLGAAHPFGQWVAEDLVQLCHHRDAGDVVISGFCADGPCLSFPLENGAHAGPGPHETHAFVAMPRHTGFQLSSETPLRPAHLREAGLRILGRTSMPLNRPRYEERAPDTLRVMTYNVHSCVGIDGRRSLERIARVIATYDPDIVALQELDVGRARSDHEDQAQEIADMVEMLVHFHPAIAVEEEHYGDAILSKHPMELVQGGELPGLFGWPRLEPRGALWVDITLNGQVYHVFNTHLGLHPWERRRQVNALVGEQWLLNERCAGHRIMCGDFNAGPRSAVCRKIGTLLSDSQLVHENHRPKRTFHSRYPVGRIDHVFVENGTEITRIEIPSTNLTRVASDHLPLIVEFRMG